MKFKLNQEYNILWTNQTKLHNFRNKISETEFHGKNYTAKSASVVRLYIFWLLTVTSWQWWQQKRMKFPQSLHQASSTPQNSASFSEKGGLSVKFNSFFVWRIIWRTFRSFTPTRGVNYVPADELAGILLRNYKGIIRVIFGYTAFDFPPCWTPSHFLPLLVTFWRLGSGHRQFTVYFQRGFCLVISSSSRSFRSESPCENQKQCARIIVTECSSEKIRRLRKISELVF